MEDAYTVEFDMSKKHPDIMMFAVYDGHGGGMYEWHIGPFATRDPKLSFAKKTVDYYSVDVHEMS